jgi:hypothetical protein
MKSEKKRQINGMTPGRSCKLVSEGLVISDPVSWHVTSWHFASSLGVFRNNAFFHVLILNRNRERQQMLE